MSNISELFEFISASPSPYHAVSTAKEALAAAGYTELCEDAPLTSGKYYTVRDGSSLIAFNIPASPKGFSIVASHSDSPALKVKVSGERRGAYTTLDVERYGGMIYSSWFDRPLSVAGRVVLKSDGGVRIANVDIARDLAVIPNVAIHFNRAVNDGYKYNPAVDLLPLMTKGEGKGIVELVASKLGVEPQDVLSHDLFLYNRDTGRTFGAEDEYILAPRIDDLGCAFASLKAHLSAKDSSTIPVLAIFDNEEVGSETKKGAASDFLLQTLKKIAGDSYDTMINNSFMISADNAHAIHPNHPELSDSKNAPRLNGGVVVKYNANQRYTTDAVSDALLRTVAERAGVTLQSYTNRADMPGGSTLGSISNTKVAVRTVDIGLPQLAMHSANETAGAQDLDSMITFLTEFYSTAFIADGDTIKLVK
ncbi:MAG: M18 family aminopeptidase [Clostridia bacterium]|nr:M18 family aminopeptidase [Clostridia bacterium]